MLFSRSLTGEFYVHGLISQRKRATLSTLLMLIASIRFMRDSLTVERYIWAGETFWVLMSDTEATSLAVFLLSAFPVKIHYLIKQWFKPQEGEHQEPSSTRLYLALCKKNKKTLHHNRTANWWECLGLLPSSKRKIAVSLAHSRIQKHRRTPTQTESPREAGYSDIQHQNQRVSVTLLGLLCLRGWSALGHQLHRHSARQMSPPVCHNRKVGELMLRLHGGEGLQAGCVFNELGKSPDLGLFHPCHC